MPSEAIPLGLLNVYFDSEISLRRPPVPALSSVTEFPLALTIQTCSPSEVIDTGFTMSKRESEINLMRAPVDGEISVTEYPKQPVQ